MKSIEQENNYRKLQLQKRVTKLNAEVDSDENKAYVDNYLKEHLLQIKEQSNKKQAKSSDVEYKKWLRVELEKFTNKLDKADFKLNNKDDIDYNFNYVMLMRSWEGIIKYLESELTALPTLLTLALMCIEAESNDFDTFNTKQLNKISSHYGNTTNNSLFTKVNVLRESKQADLNKESNKKHFDWIEKNYPNFLNMLKTRLNIDFKKS